MYFLQAINSDISVIIVCNKTGGTIKGDKKNLVSSEYWFWFLYPPFAMIVLCARTYAVAIRLWKVGKRL